MSRLLSRGLRIAALAAGLSLLTFAASAHQLMVFAAVDGQEVVVETKFSNGKVPKTGTVTVYDGEDKVVGSHALSPDGTARFPLEHAESGLRIEVSTGEGHDNYWVLTPDDIAKASSN